MWEVVSKILWYLKQLFPFQYHTVYGKEDGSWYMCVWRMWFGRCFDINEHKLDKPLP